jgi:hypothetical protein
MFLEPNCLPEWPSTAAHRRRQRRRPYFQLGVGTHIPKMETIVKCDCGAEYKRTEAKFLLPHTGHVSCKVGAVLGKHPRCHIRAGQTSRQKAGMNPSHAPQGPTRSQNQFTDVPQLQDSPAGSVECGGLSAGHIVVQGIRLARWWFIRDLAHDRNDLLQQYHRGRPR